MNYSKTCGKSHIQKDQKLVFNTNYHLMQVESTAECSKGSNLLYFRPALSLHLSLRYLFCLFLSGRFTQCLLYNEAVIMVALTSRYRASHGFCYNEMLNYRIQHEFESKTRLKVTCLPFQQSLFCLLRWNQ